MKYTALLLLMVLGLPTIAPSQNKLETLKQEVQEKIDDRAKMAQVMVDQAWEYFKEEQSSKQKYVPMITETDEPPTYLNKEIMDQYRPQLKEYYYDETKYDTYLEQLGVSYPTLRANQKNSIK